MNPVAREDLKKVFKKVKKLHLPKDLESLDFTNVNYFSWADESSQCLYIVADYKDALAGIKLDYIKAGSGPLRLGFCEFCHKHRKSQEVLFVSAETKKRPKNVNYRVRGTWICADYRKCNDDLKNVDQIRTFFFRMLDEV